MRLKTLLFASFGTLVGLAGFFAVAESATNEQFFPMLVYRTGPYAPSGIPIANGMRDYYTLINKRDHGINGVTITFEECETQYNTKLGVECYEKLKNKGATGATLFNPYSTGITYQLIPKSTVDKVPILSMGYGMTAAADGTVFPYVFNFPMTYWGQASAFIRYVGEKEGGLDKLKGKKIALVYHNSAYGKEPIPTLEVLSKKYGFDLKLLAVDHPGQEQGATWLQIRQYRPNWIFMWGWGVMNSVAVKEAASIRFPMDHFVGVWWSGSEADVLPAGQGAVGYTAGTFNGAGTGWPVFDDIVKYVYNGDRAEAAKNHIGEVLYNRGVINAMFGVEAVRTAQGKYGKKALTGEQVRWGLENLNVTADRLKQLGMTDFTRPIKVTCQHHNGIGGHVYIQQWDGKNWKKASDWYEPMQDVVWSQVEAASSKYAKDNNVKPRVCSKAG